MDRNEYYVKESLKLFLKYGVKSVTIGQITQHLNVSSKTLYQLFGDKTGLVHHCVELYRTNTAKTYEQLMGEAENVADAFIRFYNSLVDSMRRINPNFFVDVARYFPQLWNQQEAFGMEYTRELVERGIREGIFIDGIHVGICAETLTLLVKSIFERDPLSEQSTKSQVLMANVIWPYLRGISTPEGRQEFRKYRRHAIGV
ncbi:MAG: TetR/AcrR family transcriptional regulator [Bacteroidota bacterium]